MEFTGYGNDETGNSNCEVRSPRLQSWEVHKVVVPSSITSIKQGTFGICRSLGNIVIPNSVTSIEFKAFYHCVNLTNIIIPNSVTSIGEHVFFGCTSLKEVVVKSTNPISVDENTFANNAQDIKIFVPKESLDDYKQKWSDYKDNVFPIE